MLRPKVYSSYHSVIRSSRLLTHNFLPSLSGAFITMKGPQTPLSLSHLAAALFKWLSVSTFSLFILLLCAPPPPQLHPVFTDLSADTTTPGVWTPWGNLSFCCSSGQMPFDQKDFHILSAVIHIISTSFTCLS